MASVRQRSPGRWQLIVYTGRDPLTGEKHYARQTVDAAGKRDAQEKARRWELELRDGQLSGDGGTFGELCAEWIKVKSRRWSPSTLKEHRRIVKSYLARPLGDVDVAKIRTHTLDVLYGELAERGGACQRRRCPRPVSCGVEGHPKRCQRVECVRSWVCTTHDRACATWMPCEESPCEHGAPLDVSTVLLHQRATDGLVAEDGDLGVVASRDQGHEPGDLTGVNEGLETISDRSHSLTLAHLAHHAHPALAIARFTRGCSSGVWCYAHGRARARVM